MPKIKKKTKTEHQETNKEFRELLNHKEKLQSKLQFTENQK